MCFYPPSHEVDTHNVYPLYKQVYEGINHCTYHHYCANGLNQSPSVDELSSTVARYCGEFRLPHPIRSSKFTHPICSPENFLLRFKDSIRIFIYLFIYGCQRNVQFQISCIISDFKIRFTNTGRQDIKPHITHKNTHKFLDMRCFSITLQFYLSVIQTFI
jgi:hypothetical protein